MAINDAMLDTMSYLHGAYTTDDVVENWHDDKHPGAFKHCSEQPCHAVNRLDGESNPRPPRLV